MNIYEKIEEIRSKPEHVRRQYVWAMVAISMVFILAIWFFSMKSEVAADKQSVLPDNLKNSPVINQFNEQKDSLKGAVEGINGAMQQQGQ